MEPSPSALAVVTLWSDPAMPRRRPTADPTAPLYAGVGATAPDGDVCRATVTVAAGLIRDRRGGICVRDRARLEAAVRECDRADRADDEQLLGGDASWRS